jgi:hypothetical protein
MALGSVVIMLSKLLLSVLKPGYRLIQRLPNACQYINMYIGETRNIRKKKFLYSSVSLTNEQKKEIDDFYIYHYGKKISYKWHRLYQSYTGTFRKDYIPEIIYTLQIAPKLNPADYCKVLQDKNLLRDLFSIVNEVRCPKTYGKCTMGHFSVGNRMVDRYGFIDEMKNVGICVIKKTVGTSSGEDVSMCNFINGLDVNSGSLQEEIIRHYGNNFNIQERIEPWHELAHIYSKSINTFRVITYICDGKILTSPLSLRMGKNGADKDNIHFGGIVVGVSDDGYLKKEAFSEFQERFLFHPNSNVVFEGYHCSKVQDLLAAAKKLHQVVPYIGVISWDLTIDSDGCIVLVEMNLQNQSAWFPQMINGESLFRENTGRILEMIRKN